MIRRDEWNETLLPTMFAERGIPVKKVNPFGLRDESGQKDDVFNDWFGIWVPEEGAVYLSVATTDPGIEATKNKEGGAAHLCLGHHPDIWIIDTHAANVPAFAHLAFCSREEAGCKPTKIWRDVDRDTVKSKKDREEKGFFGINGHRASRYSDLPHIGPYSYGCQVVQHRDDFDVMLSIAQRIMGKGLISYTLFPKEELWPD